MGVIEVIKNEYLLHTTLEYIWNNYAATKLFNLFIARFSN